MGNELLVLVDKASMHTYKGSVDDLENNYSKLGLKLDDKYEMMTFRGNISVLGNFTENNMTYFDEIQIFGRGSLFIISDTINTVKEELLKYPMFDLGYWHLEEQETYLLLVHKGSLTNEFYYLLNQFKAKEAFKSLYTISKQNLESIKKKNKKSMKNMNKILTIFKCYSIGSLTGITEWHKLNVPLIKQT
ncbi:hypothetical protein LCGC14_0727480 [marine sediment metagenome]|uniref:Uncharacterized protein n=1 Tax=marine sediment metagenome TaxID=412755 RepID=A0A0F9THR9_9ZZZZ|nr:hypothetical protein [archaeon]HEC37343.1 hypothetical protein [bacterium]